MVDLQVSCFGSSGEDDIAVEYLCGRLRGVVLFFLEWIGLQLIAFSFDDSLEQ